MFSRFKVMLAAVSTAVLLFSAGASDAAIALPPQLPQWRQIDLAQYPDADTILLDDHESVVYSADGNYVLIDDYFVYLKTEKGRDGFRTFSLSFNEFYNETPELSISVIRPDNTIMTPPAAPEITTNTAQMQSAIYDPANKELSLSVPGVEIGDVVHIQYKMVTKHPRMQGVWCDVGVLQSTEPVLRYVYTVSAPEAAPLKSITVKNEVKGCLAFKEEKKDGRIYYTWTASNVPQIHPEPGMPPVYLCAMRVLASTAPDWETVSRWYWNLCKPHLDAVSPELTAKSKELAKDKTPEAAIRAIFDFVSKEVRYTGITDETTAPGYEPHDVNRTFAQLHGVCRDKAALLAAMLREAGFEAFPVLIMVDSPKDAETPNNYFNHAITGVRLASGETVLMDSTNENTADLLPAYEMDKSYLIASPEGDTLRRTPEIPAAKNTSRVTSTGALDKDFTLTMHVKIEFLGINDAIFRGAFAQWTPEQLRRFWAGQVKAILPGAELTGCKVFPEDVRDLSQPLVAELDYQLTHAVDVGFGDGLLHVPFLRFGALSYLLDGTGLDRREYPLLLDSTAAIAESVSITLPENLAVAGLPEFAAPGEGAFTAATKVELVDAHTLRGTSNLTLNTATISPEEYAKLKAVLKTLEADLRARVVVRRTMNAADAAKLYPDTHILVEKNDVTLEITDESSSRWHAHQIKKVLDYGGVKSVSQWQCGYYPDWEKVELIGATVTAPDGSQQAFPASAVKIMDAPGNADAPRYPAAKIMVAALPGVAPGSEIDLEYAITTTGGPTFAVPFVLNGTSAILEQSVTVTAPEALLNSLVVQLPESGFPWTQTVQNGRVTWQIRAQNVPPRADEPNPPPSWSFAPTAGWSFAAPERLAATYRAAYEKAVAGSAEAQKKALELTKNAESPREKVLILRNFVAEHIRAAGPDLSDVGVRAFTDADATLREGYGSSADRAALLAAMLNAVGIETVVPVAASGYPALPYLVNPLETLPLSVFDAVLLRVTLDEEEFYLGDTDQYDQLGVANYDNMLALDLTTGELITIVSSADCTAADESIVTIRCEAGGAATITMEQRYFGAQYGNLKRFFARQTPEERKRFIQKDVSSFAEDAESVEYTTKFEDYPGVITQVVKVPAFWRKSGEYLYLTLPAGAGAGDLRTSTARTLPFLWREGSDSTVRYVVEFPEDVQCLELAGRNFTWNAPGGNGSATQSAALGDRTLTVTRTVHWEPMVVAPAEYPVLAEGERLLNGAGSRTILIKVSGK